MTLKELFAAVPVHSYAALDLRDEYGVRTDTIAPLHNWCDGAMLPDFTPYEDAEVWDVRSDDEVSGLLRISVIAADRLIMESGADWKYIAQDGHVYEIAEMIRPIPDTGVCTYDIGVLMDWESQNGDFPIMVDWFAGINEITHSELLDICRKAVKRHMNRKKEA